MITASPIEALLREALDRLAQQEQRTAALEAAVFGTVPPSVPPAPLSSALAQTVRITETPTVSHWPAPRKVELLPASTPAPGATVSPAAVMAALDDAFWSVAPDGQSVLFAGGAVERLYGLTAHELQTQRGRWIDAVPADDRERLRLAFSLLPEAGSFSLEHRIAHSSGRIRWAVTSGKLIRDSEGRPLRVDGSTTDITRKARARDAVLTVLDGVGAVTAGDFLVKLARYLCIACAVRAVVVVEPHAPGEARTVVAWIGGRAGAPFTFDTSAGLVRDLVAGGSAFVPSGARARYLNDPLLLKLRAEAFAAEPLIDAAGCLLGFVAVADDRPFDADTDAPTVLRALVPRAAVELARAIEAPTVSELQTRLTAAEERAVATENALRATANLADAGRLAAGIAHDFHNMLGVIIGNADLIREGLPSGDSRAEFAETIAQTAQTIAIVSRQLVALSKPGGPNFAPLDVAAALHSLAPMLRRLTERKIVLELDVAPNLPLARADATDFDRVVLNLVLNARDASRPGSTITVRAATARAEPGHRGWPAETAPNEYIAITVSDQGSGMTPEVRARMFDLFFTTKGDRGNGLGLATVSAAVRAASGHIEVESEPGWGTTIRIYWPQVPEPNPSRFSPPAEC
ncbi:histidine kinase : Uncharacterized protein (Fragment) OS=uncultured bacterium GN=ACD_75C01340G0001 PE=4 SV=1: PAS_3: HisKA: HATPase_c [Gemmata massiliana]|uniref:histidine kinase n=1 Tax=Gemmata massiliana TaxID=1210884 RepID=A0A6P2CQ11_9BACT